MTKDFLTEEGQKYGDFVLVNCKYIDELQSRLRELIHLPSGAQVMHLENNDPENVFCLSFKTLPDSSNGAPHILEHTVLCGSRKFPIKDPFFSMNRRSLNTFMNALTGSDFTCYPAASQVEKDFYNLLEVYLDAVFHPELKELSFLQEGHRLEFSIPDDPKSPLAFKGIVYNEMKGALSSADARVWHSMTKALVPDLPYAHNSGGDPKAIPDLTYKQLIEFHETYYHPSRCLFFFYGNFPLKKHLDFIAEKALHGVQKLPPIDGIGYQKRFTKPLKSSDSYPTNETEDLETKYIHSMGWLTTPLLNQEDVLALSILDSVLMDTDASPLKKALLDSKHCVQADSYLDTEMTDVPLVILFHDCKEDAGEKLEKVLFDTLKKIAKEGISFPLIEASIHQLEFSRLEIGGDHSPFGLTLFMRSALAKQHGCKAENALIIHALFEEILEKAKDPHFFSPYIEKYLLQNPHFVRMSFTPDPKLSSKEAEEEKEHLEEIRKSLNEKQIAHILEQTKKLETFHEEVEGQKVECLPKVTLTDIPEETRHFQLKNRKQANLEIFHHETFTNHILYADYLFDLPPLDEQELFDLQLFLHLWQELGAGERNYEQNLEFMHAHTGGIHSHASLHVQAGDPTKCKPSLQLRGKALDRKVDKLFLLFEDFLLSPRLDETNRIEDLIQKLNASLQQRLSRNAMRYASTMALSGLSIPNAFNQYSYGLDFYQNAQALASDLSKNLSSQIERLHTLKEKILRLSNPQLILSCDEQLFTEIDKQGFYGLDQLPSKKAPSWQADFPIKKVSDQGRIISSPVAFTAQGLSTIHYHHPDAPALQVATVLFENKTLHHRIREQGGAYGSGASYNGLWGNFYFYSYRDPHIARTLRTFQNSIDELVSGSFSPQDLEEAKLGIIQHFDTPTSPGSRAIVGYTWSRDGKTRQMRQDFRDRLLALNPQAVQTAVEEHLQSQFEEATAVTFAGKELLDQELPLIENKKLKVLPTA